MQLFCLKRSVVFVFFFVTLIGYGQNSLKLKKGIVIDSLKVPDTDTTFSIYLPKTFDLNKNWPVLFGFDSKEKPGNIARLYKEAAEEFGYIVAISSFLENQEPKEKAEFASSFMRYVFSLFPIQKGRVYTTGIGNDAKLISLFSVLPTSNIFGVIAIGDSHYYDSSIKIDKNFSYFGIVNTNNYRYKNFLKNKEFLKRRAVSAYVLTYDGARKLPNTNLLKTALSTFTLQAIAKGRIPKDSIWVQNIFQRELKQVEVDLNDNKFVYAYNKVKRIRNTYNLFFDTSYLKEKEKQIKKLKEYKQEKRLQSKYANQESFLRQTYMVSLEEDIAVESYDNLGWWQYQMSKLDTKLLSKEKYAHDMVLRMKGFLKNMINSYKKELTKTQDSFEKRMFLNILSTIIDKKDFESYRNIISLSAQDEDYETALFYLEKLLKNDFKDIDALYNIEGTWSIKISKDYNKLIKKYLGASKYFFIE